MEIHYYKRNNNIKFKPDLDWIKASNFSSELTTALNKVKIAKRSAKHYYLAFHDGVGNADFKNDKH